MKYVVELYRSRLDNPNHSTILIRDVFDNQIPATIHNGEALNCPSCYVIRSLSPAP